MVLWVAMPHSYEASEQARWAVLLTMVHEDEKDENNDDTHMVLLESTMMLVSCHVQCIWIFVHRNEQHSMHYHFGRSQYFLTVSPKDNCSSLVVQYANGGKFPDKIPRKKYRFSLLSLFPGGHLLFFVIQFLFFLLSRCISILWSIWCARWSKLAFHYTCAR